MNLANILRDSTLRVPDKVALIFYERQIRYAELFDASMRFATVLGLMDIGPGDRVALAMPNVPEFPIAFYGAMAAGAEVVMVNPLYTVREASHIFEDSAVKLVVSHPMFAEPTAEAARRTAARLLYSDSMGDPAKADIKSASAGLAPLANIVEREPRDTALIVYTNAYRGSTLGACLTHSGMIFDAVACRKVASVSEEDLFIAVLPLFHAFSLTVCLNLSILSGGATVLHELFKESRAVEDMESKPVSLFPVVPTMIKRILDLYGGAGKDFSKVRAIIPGGGPPPSPTLFQQFEEAFNAGIYEGYGITECGPVTCSNLIYKKVRKLGSQGPPLENIDVRIVSDEGEDLPQGQVGELIVRGENVMEKYLNHPQETEQFLKDGWFYTGDLARIDDEGFIFLQGVKKRLVIVGGFNVYPAEVERELSAHPAVRSCRVFGVPDDYLSERVAAEVTLESGAEARMKELQKFLRKSLAPYKIPRQIDFV